MKLFNEILYGAKLAVVGVSQRHGYGFFHLCALSGYIFANLLIPYLPLYFKLGMLVITFIVGELGIKFAKSIKSIE